MEEHYLSKWMEGSVGDAEIVERDGAEALKNYQSILKSVDDLKVSIPESLEWEKFSQQLKKHPKKQKKSHHKIWAMAAALLVLLGVRFFFFTDVVIASQANQSLHVLTDGSQVELRPNSELRYQRSFGWWNRKLRLEGDATFRVTKGSTFTVETSNGAITVLGTVFRVISAEDFFSVHCEEGKVKISRDDTDYILEKGNRYNSVTNTVEEFQRSAGMKDNQILYNRTPLSFIAKVVAQVYGIRINLKTKNELYFTGAIPLNDQEKALQALSIPFALKTVINQDASIDIVEE